MIKLYDLDKAPVRGMTTVKDYHIQSDLETGDQTLYFSVPANQSEDILLEMYLRTPEQEYVIKEINDDNTSGMRDIVAKLNLEDLTGKAWSRFDSTEQPLPVWPWHWREPAGQWERVKLPKSVPSV